MDVAFVNGELAILVRYWEQRGAEVEAGARVELRRVSSVPSRKPSQGSAGFTVDPVSDGGLWRADLFVALTDAGRPCFHYHPNFEHDDVGERVFDEALTHDPRGWIEAELSDLAALLTGAGAEEVLASVDMNAHRRMLPFVLLAIESCLARLPAVLHREA